MAVALIKLKQFIDRRLSPDYVRLVSVLVIITFLIVLGASTITENRGRTRFGSFLGADFAAFYDAGEIFNSYGGQRIYDRDLHSTIYHNRFPDAAADSDLPYINSPFFIAPFIALAKLQYRWAYLVWVCISVALFIGGLRLLFRSLTGLPENLWSLVLLVSLSFMPLLLESLGGGQSTAFGFFFLALAVQKDIADQPWQSGLALSICLYKPTLLVLILPMLVIRARPRVLAGFVVGAIALSVVSLLLCGIQGCESYIRNLLNFGSASTAGVSVLRDWKYVDINTFFRLLTQNKSWLRWTLAGATALTAGLFLLRAWWRTPDTDGAKKKMVWASAIAFTPVLNIYFGIYDSSLIILSALLTAEHVVASARSSNQSDSTLKYMLLALYVVPWITQQLAQITHVQLFTIVLFAFGIFVTNLYRQSALAPLKYAVDES